MTTSIRSRPAPRIEGGCEVLGRTGRPLQEGCSHPYDQVPDAKGVERVQQGPLSGSECELGHVSGHAVAVRTEKAAGF